VITELGATSIHTAPRERGWRWLVLALLGAVAVTWVTQWPASLALVAVMIRLTLPLQPFLLLVACGLGACALASWVRGGAGMPALVAGLGLLVLVWRGPMGEGAVWGFTSGWALLVGASFGWWCLGRGSRGFLERALPALALASVGALVSVMWSSAAGPSAAGQSAVAPWGQEFEEELGRRREEALAAWQVRITEPSWTALRARVPSVAASADQVAAWMAASPTPTALVPALLLLESLVALALAWSIWHRLARSRLGPPLSRLSAFRFDDQLIWGLVVGATLVLLPSLKAWHGVGVNLLVLFGALYALRGLGVLVWWIPDRWAILPLLVLLVCVPLLGPVQVLATVAVLALGLGLGDTWRDFRRTARPMRSEPRP
jgi:hypothetical protein